MDDNERLELIRLRAENTWLRERLEHTSLQVPARHRWGCVDCQLWYHTAKANDEFRKTGVGLRTIHM